MEFHFKCFYAIHLLMFLVNCEENCPPRQPNVQRKCQKPCVVETDCKSKRKDCKCDGDCGLSCININLKCESAGEVSYGRIDIIPYNRFGAIAKYTCNEGYQLQGKQARVCQGDGKWSLEAPECRLRKSVQGETKCGPPPVVSFAQHNGDLYQTSYAKGIRLQYTCDRGTISNDNDITEAWCVGEGIWVGPKMTCSSAGCSRPKSIENGRIRDPLKNNFGDKLEYECDKGYYLTGRRYRVCLANGTWDGQEPSCETVICSEPPYIMYAVHDGFDETSLYPAGRQITYKCKEGYQQNGGHSRAMCNGEGEWVGLGDFKCSAINCGFPYDLKDGWREGHLFSYKNQIKYFCKQGYTLHGSSIMTCESNGKWGGVPPKCLLVECPHLSLPENGNIVGSGNAYGIVLRFECEKGYKLVGSIERRCQENGQWSGVDVECAEINCGWPGPFYNGFLLGQKTTVGSIIFFSCIVRTNFEGSSLKTECLANGSWSHPPPLCLGQCMVPFIPNATVDKTEGTYVRHESVLIYQCEHGLVPNNTNPVKCNNGTWTSIPRCTPASCKSPPPHVDSGLRIFEGLKHGDRAKYICRNGFHLIGITDNTPYIMCKYGTWSGGKPKCKEFYCQNPAKKPFENGVIYKKGDQNKKFIFQKYISTIRHGTRLIFVCNPGYIRKGPSGATCVNGTWSPSIDNPGTKCVQQNHPAFPKLWKPLEEMESDILL